MLQRAKEPVEKTIINLSRISVDSDLPVVNLTEAQLGAFSSYGSFVKEFGASFDIGLAQNLRVFLNEQRLFLEEAGTAARESQRLVVEYNSELYYSNFLTASDPTLSSVDYFSRSFFTKTQKSNFLLFEIVSKTTKLLATNFFYYTELLTPTTVLIINGKNFSSNIQIFSLETRTFSNFNIMTVKNQINLCVSNYNTFNFNFNYFAGNLIFRPFAQLTTNLTLLSPI